MSLKEIHKRLRDSIPDASITLGDGSVVKYGTEVGCTEITLHDPFLLLVPSDDPTFSDHVMITPAKEEYGQIWYVHPCKLYSVGSEMS